MAQNINSTIRLIFFYIILFSSLIFFLWMLDLAVEDGSYFMEKGYQAAPTAKCSLSDYYFPQSVTSDMTDQEKTDTVAQNESDKATAEDKLTDCNQSNQDQTQYQERQGYINSVTHLYEDAAGLLVSITLGLIAIVLIRREDR